MENNKRIASISALKQYLEKNKQNMDRHTARILIHANKKDYGFGMRTVYVNIKENYGEVIIENLETLCDNCSNIFTTSNSDFSLISGTLSIKTKTILGEKIIVNIT